MRVPSLEELRALQLEGSRHGYNGFHIYLRYQAVLEMLQDLAPRRVLVVGCGFGIFDRLLPEDIALVGLDLGEDEITVASAWAAAHRPEWRYARQSLEDAALPAASFDLVVLSEVLEHMPEEVVDATLHEVARVLTPDGKALITVPNRAHLRNRAREIFGQPTVLMDPTHLREYSIAEARALLDESPLRLLRFAARLLYFPKERFLSRWLPPEDPLRGFIVRRAPQLASHFLLLAERAS